MCRVKGEENEKETPMSGIGSCYGVGEGSVSVLQQV